MVEPLKGGGGRRSLYLLSVNWIEIQMDWHTINVTPDGLQHGSRVRPKSWLAELWQHTPSSIWPAGSERGRPQPRALEQAGSSSSAPRIRRTTTKYSLSKIFINYIFVVITYLLQNKFYRKAVFFFIFFWGGGKLSPNLNRK